MGVKCDSITISQYPTHVISWKNEVIEEEMEIISEIAAALRSQTTSIGLPPSARPEAFVRHTDPFWQKRLEMLAKNVTRLAKVGVVKSIAEGENPSGTVSDVVNANCVIFI